MSAGTRISDPVTVPSPLRVLVTAAATAAWYDADADEKQRVVVRLTEHLREWLALRGVRYVASFDDDLLLAGDPRAFGRWSIFVLLDVERLEDAVAIVDSARHGEIRLTKYFTVAATLGRAFWPAEDAVRAAT